MSKIQPPQLTTLFVLACLSSFAYANLPTTTAREQVENGLRVPISTPTDKQMRLTDRMTHYQVPAGTL